MTMTEDYRLDVLARLAATIAERKAQGDATSYTAGLLQAGTGKCAKKFGEEAFEVALAAVAQDDAHVTAEAADVLYHLLVLLAARDISLKDVMTELEGRTAMSGIEEKATRPTGGQS